MKELTNKQKIKNYLTKIRKLVEKVKYCPFCGSEKVINVAHTDSNDLVYACFDCKKGFSARNLGNDVVKGGKNDKS